MHKKPMVIAETAAEYLPSGQGGASELDIKSAWWKQVGKHKLGNGQNCRWMGMCGNGGKGREREQRGRGECESDTVNNRWQIAYLYAITWTQASESTCAIITCPHLVHSDQSSVPYKPSACTRRSHVGNVNAAPMITSS